MSQNVVLDVETIDMADDHCAGLKDVAYDGNNQKGGDIGMMTDSSTDIDTDSESESFDIEEKEDELDASGEDVGDEVQDKMKKNYSYPDPSDPHIQYKLYKKREFYNNRIGERPVIDENTKYSTIEEYRTGVCGRSFMLHAHQGMLSNLINPDTPYRGIIVFHGLGTGKCVHKDTMVYINGYYRPIESIWRDYRTSVSFDLEGGEWSVPSDPLIATSFDENLNKMIKKKVMNLYREKITSHMRKIYLDNGKSVCITDIHKLLTTEGWTNALDVGTTVLVPESVDITDRVTTAKIIGIDHILYDDYVYDLEIEDTHNYVAEDIICHNTCVGVAIAENFKEMVQKYGTKIYILVPGPIIKEHWRSSLTFCTGETYKKYQDKYTYFDPQEKARQDKQALAQALQYYKLMSYRSFYKRVLGEKIVDKKVTQGNRTKTTYRKTKEGDFERDIAIDRIYNLDNSIIIVDEAHNLTGNAYGKALDKIIKNSKNLRVILMSATPMKNLGSDIIELVNFIRPQDSPMERDRVFNSHKNHLMDFKPGGKEYFKKMVNGYISHVRGSDPLIFAKRIDRGIIPKGLLFTNLIRCEMHDFQRCTYDSTIKDFDDALDRASEAVANMSFPGLSKDRKSLVGYYGRDGVNVIKEQLKVSGPQLNKMIGQRFFGGQEETDLLYITNDGKTVTGKIYKAPYLKNFSIKFYKALKKVNRLVAGKKGPKTAFIYSNLVKVGIDVFQEILLQNGYLEFQEDPSNYQIDDDTVCYYCGKTNKEHKQISRSRTLSRLKTEISQMMGGADEDSAEVAEVEDLDEVTEQFSPDSDSATENADYVPGTKCAGKDDGTVVTTSATSTEYSESLKDSMGNVPQHKFYPATFVSITGKSSEEKADVMSEDKKRVLDNYFNKIENKEGKYIKLVLGSKVMNEGISMKHVGEVHILDVYFNLGKVDQVVGRAIRWCSHYGVMGENNVFPYVSVYKYAIALDEGSKEGLTSEEELYRKAEQKYILIKKIERAMKENAFDCPLNMHGNIIGEEVKANKGCDIHSDKKCPAICDYQNCEYKCDDPKLNREYYDPNRAIYKLVDKVNLDYSTFTHKLAESEITAAKKRIKEMYITKSAHTLRDIIEYVRKSYTNDKKDMFDEFFVYKALDDMIPITENDFNNFKDTIIDKDNTQGYLIYRDKYYIFQPFTQSELVPLYYRSNKTDDIQYELSLYHYLKNLPEYKKAKVIKKGQTKSIIDDGNVYSFDETLEYYDTRNEYKYVGIVDKEATRRKSKAAHEIKDVFKIREKLPKILDKKRGTGIPSLKGAVCSTSKSKDYLEKVAKDVGAEFDEEMTRIDICSTIENAMLMKEKYATDKKGDKYTYVRIPSNHPTLPFPLNLEDRVKYVITKLRNEIKFAIDIKTSTLKKKSGDEKGMPSYAIIITKKPQLREYHEFLKGLGATDTDKEYTIMIE